jgi:hypothetical protein
LIKAPDKTWRQLIAKDDVVFYDRNLGKKPPVIDEETRLARLFLKRYGLDKGTTVKLIQIGNELPEADISIATLNAILQKYKATPFYILPHKLLGSLFSGIFPVFIKIASCIILIIGGAIISPKAFNIYKLNSTINALRKNSTKNVSDTELKLIALYRSINKHNPDMLHILKTMADTLPRGEILSVLWKYNKLTVGSIEPINIKNLNKALINYEVKNAPQNIKNL